MTQRALILDFPMGDHFTAHATHNIKITWLFTIIFMNFKLFTYSSIGLSPENLIYLKMHFVF